jgi:hypothetical protein
MSISKNYTNARGIATAYHRVVQVMVNPSQVLATVHSWPTKGMYEAAGPMTLASVVETLEVPSSVLAPDAITAIEQWLINDQTSPLFGGTMDTDADELTRAKATKQRLLRERRDALETGGVTVEGVGVLATDVSSQRLLTGAAVLALISVQREQPFSIAWTLADLSTVQLDANEVISCSVIVGNHVASVFTAHRVASLAVEAASTVEEVNAVAL